MSAGDPLFSPRDSAQWLSVGTWVDGTDSDDSGKFNSTRPTRRYHNKSVSRPSYGNEINTTVP